MSGGDKQLELEALAAVGEMLLFDKARGNSEEAAYILRCVRLFASSEDTEQRLITVEVIHHFGPWKNRAAVEIATLEWVHWYNHHRLLGPLGYIPPAEAEANYQAQLLEQANRAAACDTKSTLHEIRGGSP